MTRPRSFAALLMAAALLAGCSRGSGQESQSAVPVAVTTTASPTPSPTPTLATEAQAAQIYLASVTPANKATSGLNIAIKAHSLERIHAAAKVCATTNQAFLTALTKTQWPKNVQANADKLSETVAADQTIYSEIITAKTLPDVDDLTASMSADNSQAQLMRVKLGLGAAPAV
jgi:hypothetical protein